MENMSMLPQPSMRSTGSVMRALTEVSESDNNARATMPPPPSALAPAGLKRQGSNLPEPAQKRKAPLERPSDHIRSHSSIARPASAASQNPSNASSLYRSTSNASSLSRSTSISSRNTSNSSYSGSLNSGIRPPASLKSGTNTVRPKSSYAADKTFGAASKPSKSIVELQASHEAHSKKNFDPDEKYNDFKRMFEDYKQMHQDSMQKIDNEREQNSVYREKMTELEKERSSQTDSIISLRTEKSTLQFQLANLETTIKELKQVHEERLEELKRSQREDLQTLKDEHREEMDRLRTDHKLETQQLQQRYQDEVEQERSLKADALTQVSTQGVLEKQQHQMELVRKDQEIAMTKVELERLDAALEREKQINNDLRESLKTAGDSATSMDAVCQALQAKVAFLESDSKSQSEAYADMEKRMNEAIIKSQTIEEKLRREETLRRRLHNQVQELKGNIRVFCRVRPTLSTEDEMAKMKFPDPEESTDIELRGMDEKNALGKDVTKTHPFSFDRVFDPHQTNDDVFGEISQLIQSALDGYNVCIFAYGQTGSGKTYTMSSEDGMIPRALRQIYNTSRELGERGWTYKMQGSFIEVYNEELRDLLSDDKTQKKHEIHHDLESEETTITNVTTLNLDSQEQVESLLSQAMSRRSVAATKANEHSSRSHSVFILKLVGENTITGEKSKGTLNLVDLAGSERIKNAETSGQRLKETQSINKSLSCLGDVIGALGQGQAVGDPRASLTSNRDSPSTAHIPYRNSKLTYLLQLSLGGNCKTLMFVMVAPEKKCLSETLTSLKFAEKVSKTRVGTAKKTK